MMVRKPNEKEMTMGEGKAVLAVGAIMVDMLCHCLLYKSPSPRD